MKITNTDPRLDALKKARLLSGLPLDFWEDLTEGLVQSALDILVGRSSIFPKYMNSKGKL
jgi:hypothetical protein